MANRKKYDAYFTHYRRQLKNLLRKWIIWEDLPESIDSRALNDLMLFEGYAVAFKYKNELVVAQGALSGIDIYQRPTNYTSANSRIVPAQMRTIGKDCVVGYNTANYTFPESFQYLINMYANRLAEVDISVDTSVKNSRVAMILNVSDDKEAIRTQKVMDQIYEGESSVLSYKSSFSNTKGIDIVPIKSRDNIVVSELSDARRNILADFYAAIGVDTIAVDKKERTNLQEMDSNKTQLLLAKSNILEPRERFCEEVNAMFGTKISVHLNEAMEVSADVSEV